MCVVCAHTRVFTLTGQGNCIMGDWFREETMELIKLWDKIKGGLTEFQACVRAVDGIKFEKMSNPDYEFVPASTGNVVILFFKI